MSRSIAAPSGRNVTAPLATRLVYHADRAASLIPDDDQWKSIIEKGL